MADGKFSSNGFFDIWHFALSYPLRCHPRAKGDLKWRFEYHQCNMKEEVSDTRRKRGTLNGRSVENQRSGIRSCRRKRNSMERERERERDEIFD